MHIEIIEDGSGFALLVTTGDMEKGVIVRERQFATRKNARTCVNTDLRKVLPEYMEDELCKGRTFDIVINE